MFAKLAPRNLFLIALLLCLLVLALWYTFRFKTRQDQITQLSTDLQTAQTRATELRSAAAQVPALRETVAELKVKQQAFVAALPATANFGGVLDDLRQTTAANGVTMSSFAVSSGNATNLPAGVRPIGLSLSLSGTFKNLFRTIQAFETMGRFTTVNNVAMQLPQADSLDPKLESTLGLTVYTYDPSGAAATPGGGAAAAPAAAPAPTPPAGGPQ